MELIDVAAIYKVLNRDGGHLKLRRNWRQESLVGGDAFKPEWETLPEDAIIGVHDSGKLEIVTIIYNPQGKLL